jgi:hypothetical protein
VITPRGRDDTAFDALRKFGSTRSTRNLGSDGRLSEDSGGASFDSFGSDAMSSASSVTNTDMRSLAHDVATMRRTLDKTGPIAQHFVRLEYKLDRVMQSVSAVLEQNRAVMRHHGIKGWNPRSQRRKERHARRKHTPKKRRG